MSSVNIEFHKIYKRSSRSCWNDKSRVCLLFLPELKAGIYIHLGDEGINGISISKPLHDRLPKDLQTQYIPFVQIDIVLHLYANEMEEFSLTQVETNEFKKIFMVHPTAFFSESAKYHWRKAYENYMKFKN